MLRRDLASDESCSQAALDATCERTHLWTLLSPDNSLLALTISKFLSKHLSESHCCERDRELWILEVTDTLIDVTSVTLHVNGMIDSRFSMISLLVDDPQTLSEPFEDTVKDSVNFLITDHHLD